MTWEQRPSNLPATTSSIWARSQRTPMMPEPAPLRDFGRRYTAAWCSQDCASVAAFYSPDGSLSITWWRSGGRATVLYTTGHSSAPTPGQAAPGTGFPTACAVGYILTPLRG